LRFKLGSKSGSGLNKCGSETLFCSLLHYNSTSYLSLLFGWKSPLAGFSMLKRSSLLPVCQQLPMCSICMLCGCCPQLLLGIRDLTRDITAATPESYLLFYEALLSHFTSSPLQMCFKLLNLPALRVPPFSAFRRDAVNAIP
jgi:hypothetical protein